MKRCPGAAEIGRAVSMPESADPRLAGHLTACGACASVVAEIEMLRTVGRELPAGECTPAEREELRTTLLALAGREPRPASSPRWRGRVSAGAVAVLAIAGAAAMILSSRAARSVDTPPLAGVVTVAPSGTAEPGGLPPEPAPPAVPEIHVRGTVHASGTVAYSRTSEQPDEIVRLTEGHLAIDVAPLAPGERFRVVVGDAEVEVRGTSFVIEAKDDRLVRVAVAHGRVDVRREREAPAVLVANDVWERSEAPPSPPPRPSAARSVRRVAQVSLQPGSVAGPPRAPQVEPGGPPRRSDAEAAFDRGWDLLRNQEFAAAAEAFAGALDPARSPVAEDASFWRSVALTRAGRQAEARAAWSEFLAGFPGSIRRGEAEVALGWLALDGGRLDEARRRFAAAEHDPVARVAAAARTGLEAAMQRAARDASTVGVAP